MSSLREEPGTGQSQRSSEYSLHEFCVRPETARIPLADDRLDVTIEGDDLRLDANLFHEFPDERGGERPPTSTLPPGRVKCPMSGACARRTVRTRPSRNTATGPRAGNYGSLTDHPLRV
jgi:hypothetical protein